MKNKMKRFKDFINEKVQEDWFDTNPDFYLSKNKKDIIDNKKEKKDEQEECLLLYKELKKLNINDIEIKEHGKEYIVISPDFLEGYSFFERNDICKFYYNTYYDFGKEQKYKVIFAFLNFIKDRKFITIEYISKDVVNELFKYTDEYYSIYYYDSLIEGEVKYALFLTKDKKIYSQEIKEIKESETCKIVYFNNKTKGKEIIDYQSIELTKVKNELKKISYKDISFKVSEYSNDQYNVVLNNKDLNDKVVLLRLLGYFSFKKEKSSHKIYFGHLRNRFHINGSLGELKNIGLGYKIYKALLKFEGYLISDEQTSVGARKMYYNLMKDEDVYSVIDREGVDKGSMFSSDSEKVLLIWKNNPKLDQIIRILKEQETKSGRKFIYDKDLLNYINKKDNKQFNESIKNLLIGPTDDEMWDSMKDVSDEQLLKLSAKGGFYKGVEEAIKRGVDINCNYGFALTNAADNGHSDIVRLLLDNGALLKLEYNDNESLKIACEKGHLDIVKMLVEEGADVNVSRGTPLKEAANNGHIEIVKYLLEHGANPFVSPGKSGSKEGYEIYMQPINFAEDGGYTEIVKLLRKSMDEYEN